MTESGFYILFCLQQPQHGYGISQQVRQMTGGELIISAGTMYGTLSKMEKDGLIVFEREDEKRKLYQITELGKEILHLEIKRIERLYKNSKGEEPVTISKFLEITVGNLLVVVLDGCIFVNRQQRWIPSVMAKYFPIMNQE